MSAGVFSNVGGRGVPILFCCFLMLLECCWGFCVMLPGCCVMLLGRRLMLLWRLLMLLVRCVILSNVVGAFSDCNLTLNGLYRIVV